jgi:hypothetical protein
MRCADNNESNRRQEGLGDDELAAIDEIAERHDEEEAERIPHLRRGDDHSDGGRAYREGGSHRIEQWLRVIDIGNAHPTRDGEHEQ